MEMLLVGAEDAGTKHWIAALIATELANLGFQILPESEEILMRYPEIWNPTKAMQVVKQLAQELDPKTFVVSPGQVIDFIKGAAQ